MQKMLPTLGCDSHMIQSVATCYTDYAILAHKDLLYIHNLLAVSCMFIVQKNVSSKWLLASVTCYIKFFVVEFVESLYIQGYS